MQQTITKTSVIEASCEEIYDYYMFPGTFRRMVPPWENLERIDADNIQEAGTMTRVRFSGRDRVIKISESRRPYGFTQVFSKGRFAPAVYEHHFKKIEEFKTEVTHHITYTVPHGVLGKLFLKEKSQNRVQKILDYRHQVLKEDTRRIHQDRMNKSLKILLSGSTGLVGSHLLNLLPLFRHQVFTLVRRKPKRSHEIYWDPYKQTVDQKQLEGFDAVIHLSGESIAALRWTKQKKEKIYKSRVDATTFLAQSLNSLYHPPKMFLCASAVGFYGDCKERVVDEKAPQGEGFLAKVCEAWEQSARLFTKGSVISMRFGVILAGHKGFLSKWIKPFKMGFGYVMGKGDENLSWISLEDLGYQIIHLLRQKEISGPVNLTTPFPITSKEFTHTLAKVLHRPIWMKIPAACVRLIFGEMGDEMILTSIAATPEVLQNSGAVFAYPKFSDALKIYIKL